MQARLACQPASSSIFPQRFAQAACRSGDRIIFLVKFVARYLAVGYAREVDQKINDLFAEYRRPQSSDRLRILAIVVPHALLLARELTRPFHEGRAPFVLRNGGVG